MIMKKVLLTIIAVTMAIVVVAAGTKLWVHSHSGNHLSIDASDVDSISFVEPGELELSFYEKSISSNGGRFTLDVTANKSWTVSVNDPSLILGATSGSGNGQVVLTALPNEDKYNPYTAIITVTLSNGLYKQSVVTVEAKNPNRPDVPSVDGAFTIVFKVPELDCYDDLAINMFGDFQGDDPSDIYAPKAEIIDDLNYPGWYKVIIETSEETILGKLCPRNTNGVGTWNYQATNYLVIKGDAEVVTDKRENLLYLQETCKGGTVYVEVIDWAFNPCESANAAGTATFNVSFDVPNDVNINDIVLTIEGMGDDQPQWGTIAILTYDKTLNIWKATADVPANCQFKCVISYKCGEKDYQYGKNIMMPISLNVVVNVEQWDWEPWDFPGDCGSVETDVVTDVCGNEYKCVKIGSQWWMAENLRCNKYDTQSERAGVTLSTSENSTNSAYYTDIRNYPGRDGNKLTDSQRTHLGLLYNWAALVGVENGSSSTADLGDLRQGICPNGWHIPSMSEWQQLVEFIEVTDGRGLGTAASHLKAKEGWLIDGEGLDTYGFSALPAGIALGSRNFEDNLGADTEFQTITLSGSVGIYTRALNSGEDKVIGNNWAGKYYATSVRCIKN